MRPSRKIGLGGTAVAVSVVLLVAFVSSSLANTVQQTTTVTGPATFPCTGSATLSDGSPAGLTTTFTTGCTLPVTATLTYASTVSSSSSSSSTTTSASPPRLDGEASSGCGYVTTCSVTLTTTSPDIIVVACDCWPAGSITFSAKDTAGLNFIPRTGQLAIGGGQFVQEWYAIAPGPLTNDLVSVTTTISGETWYGLVAFGVSNFNTANPFMSPSPIAQANINCPNGNPCNTGVSAPAGDFVYQLGGDTCYVKQSAGTGLTLIADNTAGENAYAQYEVISSSLSSATLSFGATQDCDFGTIADVIQPTQLSTTTTSSSTSSSTSSTSGALPNDWPSFTLDSSNSRYQANSGLTSSNIGQVSLKWSIATPGSVTSTPVVLNGNVYFADWSGNVYSAKVSTGALNWKVNLGSFSISSSLAVANGLVFVGSGDGNASGQGVVYALSQTDGHTVWSKTLTTNPLYAIWASPIVYNGLVYIGLSSNGDESDTAIDGALYALNATTGAQSWVFNTMPNSVGGATVWGSVVIDPSLNALYFGTGNSFGAGTPSYYAYAVVSLNAKTGALNWYYQAYTNEATGGDLDFGSTPNLFSVKIGATTYQAVGLGNKDGYYYVLDRTNGNLLEKYFTGYGGQEGGVIGLAGFTYQSANNPILFIPAVTANYDPQLGGYYGHLVAMTPSNDATVWDFHIPQAVDGSVLVIPGAVMVGDMNGNVYAISTSNGSQLLHLTFSGMVGGGITEAENYIFIPTQTGVYVYG